MGDCYLSVGVLMAIEDHGRWISSTEFELHVPREMAPGVVIRRITVGPNFTDDPSITPAMAIEALISGHVTCPTCMEEGHD